MKSMTFKAREIKLSERHKRHLKRYANGRKTEARLKERARIVLHAADGRSNVWIARKMSLSQDTCSKWRGRFAGAAEKLGAAERMAPKRLAEEIRRVLMDAPWSGRPPKFSGEQSASIIKRACAKPSKCGYHRDHWTYELLAEDAVKREIVEAISPRTMGRILKRLVIVYGSHIRIHLHKPRHRFRFRQPAFIFAKSICKYHSKINLNIQNDI